MIKKGLVGVWLLVLFSAVGALFWYTDWVYQLPTPVPKNYQSVKTGTIISWDDRLKLPSDKPLFLHFFNPDCPCSRFNRPHFKALVRQYGSRVNFVVVVMSDKTYSVAAIQERLGLNLPVLFDESLAPLCGVYATPQAVLLDTQHRLYYRGNYNRSRYCTDEKTSYAKIALNGLLQNTAHLVVDPLAATAYGCSAPYCKTEPSSAKTDHELPALRTQ